MDKEVGGLHLHYYAICKRKLWLYSHQISFELEHDRVLEGTLLHEKSYPRKNKELMVNESTKIDVMDAQFVQETKLSSKMQKADELQLLYYLYMLKKRGIEKRGKLAYTKEKKTVEVNLDEQNEKKVAKALAETFRIIESDSVPKVIKLPYCKNCAYYDFCYALEGTDDETWYLCFFKRPAAAERQYILHPF